LIRRLAPGDERVLQEVCRRWKSRVPSEEESTRVLSLAELHVWVAEEEADLAGFAYAYELPRIDGETSVFLYELAVDERFRRRGIGRALVAEANRLAGDRRMFVLADHDNDAANRTYASAAGEPASRVLYRWR
jgi:ribosomal protein S18 acetylase RimI-like enzyme